jgi:hypothetical protein
VYQNLRLPIFITVNYSDHTIIMKRRNPSRKRERKLKAEEGEGKIL